MKNKVYVCGKVRLTVSFGDDSCWIELKDYACNNPNLRVNVYEVKYGKFVITDVDDRITCSSGTISHSFMNELETVKSAADILVFNQQHGVDEGLTIEHLEAYLVSRGFVVIV